MADVKIEIGQAPLERKMNKMKNPLQWEASMVKIERIYFRNNTINATLCI